jgi:hypothetical protein
MGRRRQGSDKKNDGLTEIPYVMASVYRDLAAESVKVVLLSLSRFT